MDITYDAQADTIDVDDITTNSNNRIVLRLIKRNIEASKSNSLWIQNRHGNIGNIYCPEGAYDMGWLGYFVSKNDYLKDLHICPFTPASGASVRDVIEPFFRGLNHNKSIEGIHFNGVNLLGGEMFATLGPFFKDNHNLTVIDIKECDLVDEGCRLFALALGSITNKSLKRVALEHNDISDEGMVDIITGLSMHPQLKYLDLDGNELSTNGCVALSTLLRCSSSELQHLFLLNNEINDKGIDSLVPALTTCSHLKQLHLCNNPSITTQGWKCLATLLEAPGCSLTSLAMARNKVDDEAAAAY